MFTRKKAKKDTERIITGLERRGETSARSKIEEILGGWEELEAKEEEVMEKTRDDRKTVRNWKK